MRLFDTVKQCVARAIIALLPPHQWYTSAYRAAGLLAYAQQSEKYPYRSTLTISRAVKLNTLLALISRQGKPFPMPIRSGQLDLFRKPRTNGLILCSTHTPLAKLALNYLVEQGFPPTVVLAADPGVRDAVSVWGTMTRIPAIRTGPSVLLKARSLLQRGETVSVMVDSYLGGPYSPNVFHLAEKLGADIVFSDVVLERNGRLDVRFQESIWNGQCCEKRVQGQMAELYQRTSSLLRHYDNSSYLQPPV